MNTASETCGTVTKDLTFHVIKEGWTEKVLEIMAKNSEQT